MCYKCAKTAKSVTFWTNKKVKQKDSEYKSSCVIGQIDYKNVKEKSKLLVKCFVNSFRKVLQYLLEKCQNYLKCHFLNQDKSQRKG